ncbi:hypothetical protein PHMEG_00031740 [Phytophthora megakarya]|uniref:Chromo domain-containing protein n=1 Tax=Phytophthora megakarya TaxID=4795 RepID=A0A225UXZ0_9STRA|nr:hypothetical protein PHMEG_00031740 [Phytophthora megakarya]
MSDTDALTVVFEECIYRRFDATSLIRHDRDPRFMSEVFQTFAELIQARSRSTLSYHPQANGQQVWSVKIVMQSVKVYVEDPLQQDWDEIAERTKALVWRREINRQQQIALEMAKEYQAVEKARRARIHNEKLSRKQQAAVPKGVNDDSPDDDSEPKVKRKVEEVAYELELPDKSGYRFYPVVHISRLKAVNEFCDRPKARLARDVAEEARFDFDEELLPEDSWMPDEVAGEFEVEAILDDRTPMSTSTDRPVHEFEVKWVGYESTTWEPASNLSCGGLLYDYLWNKKSEQRLQMVQVADED